MLQFSPCQLFFNKVGKCPQKKIIEKKQVKKSEKKKKKTQTSRQEYYSALKNDELLVKLDTFNLTLQMKLRLTMLSERNQTQKQTYYVILDI